MIKLIKKIFKYFEPLWTGEDCKISLRSSAAIALLVDFIINVHNSASVVIKTLALLYKDKVVDSAVIASLGSNLAQVVLILGIEAGLIAAMLALKTYQNNVAIENGLVATPECTTVSPAE